MTQKEIQNTYSRISGYLHDGRLRDAFRLLRNTTESSMQWEIGDEVGCIEKNYAYMLGYLTNGAADPERDKMYASIVNDTFTQLDRLKRVLLLPEQPTLYFNTLRVLRLRPETLRQRLDRFVELSVSSEIVQQIASGKAPSSSDLREAENAERDIFNHLWVYFPMSRADAETVRTLVSDPTLPAHLKQLAISATTLGLLEYFDALRLELLMDIYESASDTDLSSAALVGMLLGLLKYRDRTLPASTLNRLAAVKDNPQWASDLKTTFLELVRTHDTERINRTMKEDIIPGMMNMRPDILNKMQSGTFDPEHLEANPEWEEMLQKSGLADRIRELSELQQEGADVFMSTFSHLKSFPFFNEAACWFLPFDPERSEVTATGLPDSLASLVSSLPILCSSDKYSFVLSLGMLPESQRHLMMSQFEEHRTRHLEEMLSAENQLPEQKRRRSVNLYLQNLYRFYNLFRRKGEFYNPFNDTINLFRVKALASDFNDVDSVRVVAEFYFKRKYWVDALEAFLRLDSISDPEAVTFQKIGYCYHRLGKLDKAIDYYHQAELFDPDSRWLMGRLGAAYRAKGDFLQASSYYRKLTEADPENLEYALTLGYVLTQLEDYKGAEQQFYKVEFLDEKGTRAWRPLAWILFVTGNYDASRKYYDRVLTDSPTAGDYLNMGHVAMARAEYKEAIDFYTRSLNMRDNDIEDFIKAVREDRPALTKAGVTPRTVSMITDAVLYSYDNKTD